MCFFTWKLELVSNIFALPFENKDDRTSFSKYYAPKVETKDFNVLIDGKSFFKKMKKWHMKKLIEMSKNNDYNSKLVIY